MQAIRIRLCRALFRRSWHCRFRRVFSSLIEILLRTTWIERCVCICRSGKLRSKSLIVLFLFSWTKVKCGFKAKNSFFRWFCDHVLFCFLLFNVFLVDAGLLLLFSTSTRIGRSEELNDFNRCLHLFIYFLSKFTNQSDCETINEPTNQKANGFASHRVRLQKFNHIISVRKSRDFIVQNVSFIVEWR